MYTSNEKGENLIKGCKCVEDDMLSSMARAEEKYDNAVFEAPGKQPVMEKV